MNSDEFVSIYRDRLLEITRFIARRVEANQVEDLAADLFEVAWRKRDEIPTGYEIPWLYKTARFLIANQRRKLAGRNQALFIIGEPDSAPSAESVAVADLTLAAAWRQISPIHREILALSAWEGLSPDQIARVLEISTNAANVRLSRARNALRVALGNQEPQEA